MNTSLPTEMSEFSHSTVTALVRNCKDQPVFNTHKIFRSISQYFHEYCLKQSVPASVYLLLPKSPIIGRCDHHLHEIAFVV